MLFFKKKNSIDDSLSDKSRLTSGQFMNDCMVLDSILEDSIKATDSEIKANIEKADSLLSEIEKIKEKIAVYRKKSKILQKRKEEVANALSKSSDLVFSSDELLAIQKRKSTIKDTVAYISVNGKSKIKLTTDIVIGRSKECDVVIEDSAVSRIHSKILKKEDGFWIQDLGSTNGTFVDDVKIDFNTPVKLDKPSIIIIGTTKVFFAFAVPV